MALSISRSGIEFNYLASICQTSGSRVCGALVVDTPALQHLIPERSGSYSLASSSPVSLKSSYLSGRLIWPRDFVSDPVKSTELALPSLTVSEARALSAAPGTGQRALSSPHMLHLRTPLIAAAAVLVAARRGALRRHPNLLPRRKDYLTPQLRARPSQIHQARSILARR
jgi:hypothetical protein